MTSATGANMKIASRMGLPCTDMLILHTSFRDQPVVKVNIIGRKFRDAAARAGRMPKVFRCGSIPGTGASPDYVMTTIKTPMPSGFNRVGR